MLVLDNSFKTWQVCLIAGAVIALVVLAVGFLVIYGRIFIGNTGMNEAPKSKNLHSYLR